MLRFWRNLYINPYFYVGATAVVVCFVMSYFFPGLFMPSLILLGLFGAAILFDGFLLFGKSKQVRAVREGPAKLSNGDESEFRLVLESNYGIPLHLQVYDEVPVQFQRRDIAYKIQMHAHEQGHVLRYHLRPTRRGPYHFGKIQIYASSPLRLLIRRHSIEASKILACYPSFLQLRKYELLAMSNRLNEVGVKKMRRLGHSTEFEQIKEYVEGDDYRTLNWKATARRGQYMVNQYTEERSQPVYCMIDKGRTMKMPFDGLSLLDYAINASLVLSNIALHKYDKAGLVTFSERMGNLVKADRRPGQMNAIMEVLYHQKTRYLESDYEMLYANVRRKINQRSLIFLFTNFETKDSLERQLPFLRRLNRDHWLIVIFFENTALSELAQSEPKTVSDIYEKVLAEKFMYDKRQIVRELHVHGIQAVMSKPANLTVDTLNKYLEIKARNTLL